VKSALNLIETGIEMDFMKAVLKLKTCKTHLSVDQTQMSLTVHCTFGLFLFQGDRLNDFQLKKKLKSYLYLELQLEVSHLT
jgi:hypothetical protein